MVHTGQAGDVAHGHHTMPQEGCLHALGLVRHGVLVRHGHGDEVRALGCMGEKRHRVHVRHRQGYKVRALGCMGEKRHRVHVRHRQGQKVRALGCMVEGSNTKNKVTSMIH
eukprot:1160777-Pelagomonas_calceolata.AAC.5